MIVSRSWLLCLHLLVLLDLKMLIGLERLNMVVWVLDAGSNAQLQSCRLWIEITTYMKPLMRDSGVTLVAPESLHFCSALEAISSGHGAFAAYICTSEAPHEEHCP